MRFGEAFMTCMRKYADFSGRARRSEYWWYYLAVQIILTPFAVAFFIAYMYLFVSAGFFNAYSDSASTNQISFDGASVIPLVVTFVLMMLVALAFTLPSYAAMVRRLHDTGQPGTWALLGLAGLSFVPVIMCIMDTQPWANQWGPDPKAAERVANGYPPAYPTITPSGPPPMPPVA